MFGAAFLSFFDSYATSILSCAAGRTRTDTLLLVLDFESSASTNSTTAATAVLILEN